MRSHWQDIVLAISLFGFNLALLPTVFGTRKPALSTSLLTVIFQVAALGVYADLSLWYSALMSFINAGLWLVLGLQRLKQTNISTKP